MARSHLSVLLVFLSLMVGCAGSAKSGSGASTRATLAPGHTARQKIEQLARRESQIAPADGRATPAHIVAVPPGVDPAVLTRRDPEDPVAFISLSEAQSHFAQQDIDRNLGEVAPRTPVDPENAAEALHHYAKGRAAALDHRTLQAIVELQKAHELDPNSPEILRELAHSYLAENQTTQAIDAYRQLIRLQPGNTEALFAMGLASAGRRDFEMAISALARLRLAAPSDDRDPGAEVLANFALATALRELGYDRASIQAARLTVDLSDELLLAEPTSRLASVYRQRGETWRMIGDAHCRLGEYVNALDAYAKSASLPTADPAAIRPRIIYADLCLKRAYSAQLELLNGLTAQPGEINERDIRLCAYVRQQVDSIEALTDAVTELYRASPDESSIVRAAAALMPPDQARNLLKDFVARKPRDLGGVTHLLTWVAQQDVTAAIDLAVALVHDNPDLAEAYTDRLAVAVSQPSTLIAAVRSVQASAARARVETKLLWRTGGLGEAWTVCDAARKQWPDDRGLAVQQLQLAAAMQETGLFEKTLATAPPLDDAVSLIGLSQARRALNQYDAAVDLARAALDREPQSVDALVELARAWLALAASMASDPEKEPLFKSAVEQAISHAESAIAAAPDRDDPYEVLSLIYMTGGVRADAALFREMLQHLRESNPQSPLFARLTAQESIAQRRYEQAIDRLVNLYETNPLETAALSLAVTAWQQWGKLDAAEQWINQQMTRRPGDPALLEQWVRVQLLLNHADAAIKRLEFAISDDPGDYFSRRVLETVYRATGQTESAKDLGERRLLSRPQGVRREVELAALYAGAELADPAIERLEWIRDHAADATLDELAGALRVVGRLPDDDARRDILNLTLVERAIERFPDAPLQVYGSGLRVLARMGELGDRFDRLASAAALQARGGAGASLRSADEWRELVQGLVDDEHPEAAARALRARLHSTSPLDDDALGFLARLALISDAAADASRFDEKHAAGSIELLNWLDEKGKLAPAIDEPANLTLAKGIYEVSVFYTLVGSRKGADRLLAEVIRLDADHAMALNNLGYSQLDQGHFNDQTIEFIEHAFALMPDEPNILDTIGWLRYKQGRFEDVPDPAGNNPVPGALTLIQRSIQQNTEPSAEVLDHLGDAQWRLGNATQAADAWKKVVQLLEESNYQQWVVQNLQLVQLRVWQLLVFDTRTMYDREYSPILARAKQKLAAVNAGDQPKVAPTFTESP